MSCRPKPCMILFFSSNSAAAKSITLSQLEHWYKKTQKRNKNNKTRKVLVLELTRYCYQSLKKCCCTRTVVVATGRVAPVPAAKPFSGQDQPRQARPATTHLSFREHMTLHLTSDNEHPLAAVHPPHDIANLNQTCWSLQPLFGSSHARRAGRHSVALAGGYEPTADVVAPPRARRSGFTPNDPRTCDDDEPRPNSHPSWRPNPLETYASSSAGMTRRSLRARRCAAQSPSKTWPRGPSSSEATSSSRRCLHWRRTGLAGLCTAAQSRRALDWLRRPPRLVEVIVGLPCLTAGRRSALEADRAPYNGRRHQP